MTLPPNKEGKLPRLVSFNYRPTNLCEEQGKRQKEANRLMSSSALIKWTGWPDNPEEAESLTARGEEQISWLNNFLLCPSPAHKEGGPRPWLMHSQAWRKCLCDSPAELSPNEWSVFINLEPLSCQKERRVLERRGGPGEHLHTTSLFIYRHVRVLQSPPPPPCAGEFTVRPFNFAEIGPWQLCHADEEVFEKSGTLSHLIWPSSDAPKPPPPPPHLWLPSSP